MSEEKPKKLTSTQRGILDELANGAMLVLDEHNITYLEIPGKQARMVAHITRQFLTSNRLVERKDKTRDIKTKGNGFILSTKGAMLIK